MEVLKNQNTELFFTKHAQVRMQQRSFSQTDIMTIIHRGTFINDKEVLFTRKDTEREIYILRKRIKILNRRTSKKRFNRYSAEIRHNHKNMLSEIAYLRQQIIAIDHLKNRKVVVFGNRVISCYSCTKSELKRISRTIN